MYENMSGKELRLHCKNEAKAKLKGNIGVFALSSLLVFAISFLCEMGFKFIPIFGDLIGGIFVTLLAIGEMSMSLKLLDGKVIKLSDIFDGFKVNCGKHIGMFLFITVITLVLTLGFTVLIIIPIGLCYATNELNLVLGLFLAIGLLFMSLVGIVLFLVSMLLLDAYTFSSFYMILDGDTRSVTKIFKDSKALLKGRVMDFIVFNLSFLGWFITIPFTLGLSLLWVIPYINVASASYYRYISNKDIVVVSNEDNVLL